jgi:hypothetical protein
MKPAKRNQLLKVLETETSPTKLSSKANYLPDHPEVENELFEWFRRNEQRQAVMTDDVLQSKFKELCTKRKIEVKASRSWVRKFKARRGIGLKILHGEAGSADKQWVSVSRAILPTLLEAKIYGMQTRLGTFFVLYRDKHLLFSVGRE